MKKRILVLVVWFLFIGINGFAADGDLIVNGNVGIGTTTPGAKLDVQGGSVKIGGVFMTHVVGTNPTCPSGTGGFVTKKWNARTCTDVNGVSCTIPAGWGAVVTCTTSTCYPDLGCWGYTCPGPNCTNCSTESWTEAVCIGN